MNIIEQDIEQGFIKFDEEKKNIYYLHQNDKRRNYNNPEEQVQAEAYLKLIFSYGYPAERKPRKNGEPYDFQVFNEPIPKNATKEQRKKIE